MRGRVQSKAGLALALVAAPAAVSAQAPQDDLFGAPGARFGWAVSTGVEVSSGRFGGSSATQVLGAPVLASLGLGGWTLSAQSGLISTWFDTQGTEERTFTLPRRGRSITVPVPVTVSDSTTGLADTSLSARYEHVLGPAYLAGSGAVKLPTASRSRGLGTGEVDFSVSGEVGGLGDLAPFAGGGYQFLGSPPSIELANTPFAYAGLDWRANDTFSLTGVYEYAASPLAALQDVHQLSATARIQLSKRVRLDVTAGAGLSEGAPDVLGGLRLVLHSR